MCVYKCVPPEFPAYVYPNQQTPKTPTPEEQKALQLLARRLLVKPTADAEGDAPAAGFDLTAEPRRALLLDGLLDKIGAFCECIASIHNLNPCVCAI